MDPITALQVAGTIIQLAAIATEVAGRIYTFSRKKMNLPENLLLVQQRIDILKDALSRIARQPELNQDGYASSTLRSLFALSTSIRSRCETIDHVLDTYFPEAQSSGSEKLRAALSSIGKDYKINAIADQLSQDVSYLILIQITPKTVSESRNGVRSQGRLISNIPKRSVAGFVGQKELLATMTTYFKSSLPRELVHWFCKAWGD